MFMACMHVQGRCLHSQTWTSSELDCFEAVFGIFHGPQPVLLSVTQLDLNHVLQQHFRYPQRNGIKLCTSHCR